MYLITFIFNELVVLDFVENWIIAGTLNGK